MRRSLYRSLGLALFVQLGIVGVAYVGVSLVTTRVFMQEVNQELDRTVAEHLVEEVPLFDEGGPDTEALENLFHMLMVANPSIEIYLLDESGSILAFSAPPGSVKIESIDLEPVHDFLEGPSDLPVTGVDPRNPDVSKAFSAAPIVRNGELAGYLYVVLGGQQYDSAVQMLRGSYILRMGLASLVAALALAFAVGLLLFHLLTRRLRRLAAAMHRFERGGFTEIPEIKPGVQRRGGDEIDQLTLTFRAMADRIREQLDELKRADSLRRELVANVSHDLRTPLASLQGYLETLLLKEGRLDCAAQRRYVESALQHTEHLGNLVSELFELAKLESLETRLNPEAFAIEELVQDVVQKHQLEAERKRIRLSAEKAGDLPFVNADIGLIARALDNLIDNALRHTPEAGRVRLILQRGEGIVKVDVSDTGCGIRQEELDSVFDRFYRSQGQASEAGAGLGLAITKRIIELHRSRLEVESIVGEGTTFSFDLPVHSPSADSAPGNVSIHGRSG